jgi:transcriptional regulator with XRE-family HTH domain
MLFRQALGDFVADYRYINKITLRQMITNANAKISYNYLWEIEQGRKEPSSEILNEIAKCVKMNTAELVVNVGLRMGYQIPNTAEELVGSQSETELV